MWVLIAGSFDLSVSAQDLLSNSNSEANASASPTATPEPSPTPIPLSDVITRSEETLKRLQEIEKTISEGVSFGKIKQALPELAKQIDDKQKETAQPLALNPSLETLETIEKEWQTLRSNIPDWKETLQSQATEVDKLNEELKKIAATWQETLNTIGDNKSESAPGDELPKEVEEKIKDTVNAIKKTQTLVGEKRADLLTLQSRISEQEKRINNILKRIRDAREEALSKIFVKDSPAVWNIFSAPTNLGRDVGNSFSEQLKSLSEYLDQRSQNFLIHLGLLLLLIFGLYRAKPRVQTLAEGQTELEEALTVFKMPVASALILSIIFSSWLYPQAPGILRTLLGAAALVPGIILLRRLIAKPVFPLLNALIAFYFIDRLREMTEALPTVSRILFLAEMLGAMVFLVWLVRSKRLTDKVEVQHYRVASMVRKGIPPAFVVFSAAFLTNIFGYTSLSKIIGNGILGSAYAALVIYAAVQIIESLLVFAFRVPPLTNLGMVKTHRQLILHRVFKVIRWIAVIAWIIFTLSFLSIRETVFTFIRETFTAKLEVGSINISLFDVLLFLLTVWIAFLLSRFIRFILEEDVYPRVELAGGVPYAISTVLHYLLLLAGFFIAIAALGIDLTKFTILAGAFGVGLGFGLQNIVNNFVSGLILLFERPVKVGDMIQMGERQGDLKQIGLRASIMRTLEGAEIIVPNGHLISEEVTNWTRSDPRRRLSIDVGVKYGTNPEEVIELLNEVGRNHHEVVTDPPPRTLFIGFGDSSLNFQLRAWTMSHDQWQVVKSDLAVGVWKALKEADIEVPFPQRDLHLKSIEKNEFEDIIPVPDKSGEKDN